MFDQVTWYRNGKAVLVPFLEKFNHSPLHKASQLYLTPLKQLAHTIGTMQVEVEPINLSYEKFDEDDDYYCVVEGKGEKDSVDIGTYSLMNYLLDV